MPSNRRLVAGVAALAALLALPPVAASAGTYSIDPVHSSAIFKIRHFGVSNVYGAFWNVTGTVTYDAADESAASIDVTITADSLDTNNERRDAHIHSTDFLDAKQFPEITFRSASVKPLGDGRYEIAGTLSLHGVSREITVTAEKVGEGEHPRSGKALVGFEARFTFQRTDFDMEYMVGPLSDEVEIILSFEAAAA